MGRDAGDRDVEVAVATSRADGAQLGEEIAVRVVPYLQRAGLLGASVTEEQLVLLEAAAPLINERMVTLSEAVDMIGFLFVADEDFEIDSDDAAKLLTSDGVAVVKASHEALSALDTWDTSSIEAALRAKLIDQLGLKPRNAFGPVRVAATGRRISPPLFESLDLLGRQRSLARLDAVAT